MEYIFKYQCPAVIADCVVMTKEAVSQMLLIERDNDPFYGCCAFPIRFLYMDDAME